MNTIVILVTSILILSSSFTLVPEFLTYPYLVSNGLQPYAQVVDQHMPGLVMSRPNLYDLGFTDTISYKKLYVLIVIFQMYMIGLISRRILNINSQIPIIFFGFMHLSNYGGAIWFESFIPIFSLIAIYFFMNKKYSRSGLLIGISVLFKQNAVLLLIPSIINLLRQQKIKSTFTLIIFSLIPISLFFVDLILRGIFIDFVNWGIIFNLKTYANLAFIHPSFREVFPILLMCVLSLLTYKSTNNINVKIIILWFIFTIPGLFIRYNPYQFQSSIPFISLFAVDFIQGSKYKTVKRMFFLMLVIAILINSHFSKSHNYITDEIIQVSKLVSHHTKGGDEVFLFGAQPHIYELTKTIPAGRYFLYSLPWYYSIAQNSQLKSLINHPPKYVLFDSNSEIDGVNIRVTGSEIMNHIMRNYSVKDVYKNYILYEFND